MDGGVTRGRVAISQRLTGSVTTNAITSEIARLPQNSGSSEAAAIAPGMIRTIALSTISIVVIETVSPIKRGSHRLPKGQPAPHEGSDRQRVAEHERERDRQRDGGKITPAQRSRDDKAQDFADRAAGQAMDGRLEGRPVQRLSVSAVFHVSKSRTY